MKKLLVLPLAALLMAQVPTSVVNLGWDRVSGATGYRLSVDGVIRDVGNPPINPNCQCPSVTVPIISTSGHTITVSAYNATETSPPSTPLILASACGPGRSLQDCWSATPSAPQWTGIDIGYVNPAGHSAMSGAGYTLSAGGMAMGGIQDAFHYMQQPMTTNGSITVRLTSLSAGSAGLDWREDVTAVARHVAVVWSNNTLTMVVRPVYAASGRVQATKAGVSLPVWLRLSRASGNVFTAAYADDGVVWTPLGSISMPMPLSGRVGLLTLGGSLSVAATSQFDSLTRLP